jgi:queuine tRNA-ribosyltransferase
MPVGTCGTVKGLTPDQIRAAEAYIVLGNTYHLALRPGDEIIRDLGGLHRFMGWNRPILTDSGGYQVFSLADARTITEQGAKFRNPVNGLWLELTPEKAVEIQQNLGSDIAMVLDECPPGDAPTAALEAAVDRTLRWAVRCQKHHTRQDQAQFAIVQGGTNLALRQRCAEELTAMDFPGYALGGFSVGESPEAMHAALPECAPMLPATKVRYLMGVGRPIDLLVAVGAGIDLFDCVMPTRSGRNALAFTTAGTLRLRNARHRRDPSPLDANCPCICCTQFSRAYLHHLFAAEEMLGPTLLSLHNITYYLQLMAGARMAIQAGRYADYVAECQAGWRRGDGTGSLPT